MMKKLYTLILLSLSSHLTALPTGNLYEATYNTQGFGFYGDYIYNRYMQLADGDATTRLNKTYITTNAAYFSTSMINRVNLFGTFGATNLTLTAHNNIFGITTGNLEHLTLNTETAFSYSLGLRTVALQFSTMSIGFEASYFTTKPSINSLTDPRTIEIDYIDNQKMRYRDWQIALVQSTVVPFSETTELLVHAATKYNRASIKMDNALLQLTSGDFRLADLTNTRTFGIAVGLTLAGADRWAVTAEERLIDEKALSITGQLRF